jgi:hypothetical protein
MSRTWRHNARLGFAADNRPSGGDQAAAGWWHHHHHRHDRRADYEKFERIAPLDHIHITVRLNSIGGYNASATRIGILANTLGYGTMVEKGAICYSACTLIWIAGKPRDLDPSAKLGFHSASATFGGKRSENTNKKIGEYLRSMGAPQELIDLQPKADPCCVSLVSRETAVSWGLIATWPPKAQPVRFLPSLASRDRLAITDFRH